MNTKRWIEGKKIWENKIKINVNTAKLKKLTK